MLDIKFIRDNPEVVKENIRKKYQDVNSIQDVIFMSLGDAILKNLNLKKELHNIFRRV